MMQEKSMIHKKVREKVEYVAKKEHLSCCSELIPGLCFEINKKRFITYSLLYLKSQSYEFE